jgi:hypothetical protein
MGLVPALSITRGDLARQLNEASRGSTEGARGKALRAGFVVVEVGLSLVLLAGAAVLLKSFTKVQAVDPGFDPHGVLAVRCQEPWLGTTERSVHRSVPLMTMYSGPVWPKRRCRRQAKCKMVLDSCRFPRKCWEALCCS